MKIRILVGEKVADGALLDNETADDFASLLPITVSTDDLFGREKYASLPRSISQGGPRLSRYDVGDIGYWSPGNDVAVFYKQDGSKIPDPGIIPIGKIDSGIEIFNTPGSLKVTIERAK